jgi:hypothetical protein
LFHQVTKNPRKGRRKKPRKGRRRSQKKRVR